MEGSQEVEALLIIPGSNTWPVLQVVGVLFNQAPLPVQFSVVLLGLAPVESIGHTCGRHCNRVAKVVAMGGIFAVEEVGGGQGMGYVP